MSIIKELKEEFKEDIISMSKEFDEKEGFVTCEVSAHLVLDKMDSFIKENTDIKLGRWVATKCDTCVGYNGEGYIHFSIERNETLDKIEKASNYIRTL